MAKTGIDFFTVQIGSYLSFDMRIKGRCDNEQIAQGEFWYMISAMCLFIFIAPDKV